MYSVHNWFSVFVVSKLYVYDVSLSSAFDLPSLCPKAPDVKRIVTLNVMQAIKMAARWRKLCSVTDILTVQWMAAFTDNSRLGRPRPANNCKVRLRSPFHRRSGSPEEHTQLASVAPLSSRVVSNEMPVLHFCFRVWVLGGRIDGVCYLCNQVGIHSACLDSLDSQLTTFAIGGRLRTLKNKDTN